MAVLDPVNKVRAMVSTNVLGAIGGGIAGVYLVRKYMPNKGWVYTALGVVGGALGGSYVQSMLKASSGLNKTSKEIKS
jgi:outer membrane lipoprotein SlyB